MHAQITIKELASKYLYICEFIRNYAKLTIVSYKDTFKLIDKYSSIETLQDFTREKLEQWFFYGRTARSWKASTFRHHHKRLNTFANWLVKEGYLDKNVLKDIELPRMEKRLPKTLSKDQAILLLDASFHLQYTYTFEKYRNQAIIGLMLLAGLRRGEVISLKLNHVSLDNKTLFIEQGKGKKDRFVPINSRLHSILNAYLKDRCRLRKQSIFFITQVQKDHPIAERAINNLVGKLRTSTRIEFSAHTLRHAFARLMLEGGCDIYTLSQIMGHAKITTTTIYLACSSRQMAQSAEKHSLNF